MVSLATFRSPSRLATQTIEARYALSAEEPEKASATAYSQLAESTRKLRIALRPHFYLVYNHLHHTLNARHRK
jgi:hypothetical protein